MSGLSLEATTERTRINKPTCCATTDHMSRSTTERQFDRYPLQALVFLRVDSGGSKKCPAEMALETVSSRLGDRPFRLLHVADRRARHGHFRFVHEFIGLFHQIQPH